jgi:hypothetical protein
VDLPALRVMFPLNDSPGSMTEECTPACCADVDTDAANALSAGSVAVRVQAEVKDAQRQGIAYDGGDDATRVCGAEGEAAEMPFLRADHSWDRRA